MLSCMLVILLAVKCHILYVTGRNGYYLFTVATGSQEVNYDQMCYNWMRNELDRISTVRSYWRRTLTCPCDLRLAKADGRWKIDQKPLKELQLKPTDGPRQCIYERMPRGFSTQVRTNKPDLNVMLIVSRRNVFISSQYGIIPNGVINVLLRDNAYVFI